MRSDKKAESKIVLVSAGVNDSRAGKWKVVFYVDSITQTRWRGKRKAFSKRKGSV
jgi:hypothetical protein